MRTLTIVTIVCAALTLPQPTRAATFPVNSSRDGDDVSPGDGVCATAAHDCTLRAAIREANALAGADTIVLPAGRYPLSIRGTDEDAGATGDLDITDDLVISGAGETATIIDGQRIDRVFDVHSPAHVTLSGMTITNGQPPAATDAGGLLNDGTVTLTAVTFLQNRAGRGYGWAGGLKNLGTATLTHATFSHNRAGNAYATKPHTDGGGDFAGSVGGMFNVGTATLTDVTFRGNRAGDGSGFEFLDGGDVGGMLNQGDATLINVTFRLNRAGEGTRGGVNYYPGIGGGAGGMENDGTVTLTKVNFESNRAGTGGSLVYPSDAGGGGDGGGGGGMMNFGTAVLADVSFIGNRAGRGGQESRRETGEDDGGSGGGMWNEGSLSITNATFDRNRAGGAYGSNGGDGGGLYDGGDVTTLTNVTMTRNQAGNLAGYVLAGYNNGGSGGGLSTSSASLINVTLALNRAGRGFHGGFNGGGNQLAGGATLTNTIIFGSGQSCSRGVISAGHNLDSGASCGFAAPGDLSNSDPRLERLPRFADPVSHGGFTPTLALLAGSPAIDAGDNAACPATDQRGVARPQGAACDIGAYEFQP